LADDTIKYVFLLSMALLALAYYAGFSSDVSAFLGGATALVYAVTGRDKNGKFAVYPGGGTGAKHG
jgi:hypothetical protein